MTDLASLLSIAPIFRGLVAMLLSGACFPLCGVMVIRLELIPMRYMLMHGVILGGAISLALGLPLVPVTAVVNLLLVLLMAAIHQEGGMGGASAATMVLSMSAASVITHVADVPAKDTLNLLWGSPFALVDSDLVLIALLGAFLALYIMIDFQTILALFFNREVASSLGIKVRLHSTLLVLVIALVVALAMKVLGAFLIDALLILPVLTATRYISGGIRKLFLASSICGFLSALLGYLMAVAIDWPPSAAIAICSSVLYLGSYGLRALAACRKGVIN